MRPTSAAFAAICLLASALVVAAPMQGDRAEGRSGLVSARKLLAKLPLREEDKTHRRSRSRLTYDSGYDADGDGCSTCNVVLIRDALRPSWLRDLIEHVFY